jgi:hypothetical protein
MVRREHVPARRQPGRPERRAILVVIGADRTEKTSQAKALDPSGAGHTRNPSTGVWRLVTALMEME